LCDLD
jgi:hypothetical protein